MTSLQDARPAPSPRSPIRQLLRTATADLSGQSTPWQAVDIRIAESLRVSLLEVILRLERSVPYDLSGEATMTYAPKGVVAAFVIPSSFARPAPGVPIDVPEEKPKADGATALPQDVLVVEDNMIIAPDAEAVIKRAGVARYASPAALPRR
jgi:hypothetical protein